MGPIPDRPAALHEGTPGVGALLARPDLKFHLYDLVEPTRNVETLLNEVDRDPTCIFWG